MNHLNKAEDRWVFTPQDGDLLKKARAEYLRPHIEPLLEQGLGVKAICSALNRKGIKGPRGGTIAPNTLRPILKLLELQTMAQQIVQERISASYFIE